MRGAGDAANPPALLDSAEVMRSLRSVSMLPGTVHAGALRKTRHVAGRFSRAPRALLTGGTMFVFTGDGDYAKVVVGMTIGKDRDPEADDDREVRASV